MHINIHFTLLKIDKKEGHRIATPGKIAMITLDKGIIEEATVHRTLVDVGDHFSARCPAHAGSTNQPADP